MDLEAFTSKSLAVNISVASNCEFNNSHIIENQKQQLRDALTYTERLLRSENLITSETSTVLSDAVITVGERIFENIFNMMNEYEIVTEENLIDNDELDDENIYKEDTHEDSVNDEWYEPIEKNRHSQSYSAPFDNKLKAVVPACQHPSWNLQSLRSKGSKFLKKRTI